MQVHGPSSSLHDDTQIHGYLNSPGLAIVKVGPVDFYLSTPEECDWLIKAAIAARDALLAVPPGECSLCGHAHGVHRSDCPAAPADDVYRLTPAGEAAADCPAYRDGRKCIVTKAGHQEDPRHLDELGNSWLGSNAAASVTA